MRRDRIGLEAGQAAFEILDPAPEILAVLLQTLDALRQIRWQHATAAGCRRDGVAQPPVAAERADAAEELQPGTAPKRSQPDDRDDADRAGARHVRAAAGGDVEALDVDEPQRAGPRRFLPELAARPPPRRRRSGSPTGRSSQTTALASSSASAISAGGQLARQIDGRGRRRRGGSSRSARRSRRSNAADSTCWPVCCCM